MAISDGGLSGGAVADDTTSVSRSLGTVSAGQLIIVTAGKFSPDVDPFAAGDCTKSAGTATIGTVTLARGDGGDIGASTYVYTGIWWAIVTGGGTLTMQVGSASAGSYLWIGSNAFNGNWDASSEEDENGAIDTGNALTAMGSGDATSAGAGLFIGALAINDSNNQAFVPSAEFTSIYESENAANEMGAGTYRIVGSGTTDAADWTFNALGSQEGFGAVASVAVFRESGAPPASVGRGPLAGPIGFPFAGPLG